jgi:hypothetical protein
MNRAALLLLLGISFALVGCSKSKPTAPPSPPAIGHLTLESHPAAAAVFVNGTPTARFTPCTLDTGTGAVSIRLSLLGYVDTVLTATVPSGFDTLAATLRPLPGTPRTVTSWQVTTDLSRYAECLTLDASANVYVVVGTNGGGNIKSYTATGVPIASWTISHPTNLYSAIARDAGGWFYLSPFYGGYVPQYTSAGVFYGDLGEPLAFTSYLPGLAVGGDSLFVPNHAGAMTVLHTPDGAVLHTFLLTTRATNQVTIGVFTRDAAGYLYFTGGAGDSIRKCNAMGFEVATWGMPGSVSALHAGPDGNLYVGIDPPDNILSGHAPGRIMKLTTNGVVLSEWATEHIYPSSIAVAESGDVYATNFYWSVFRWTDH